MSTPSIEQSAERDLKHIVTRAASQQAQKLALGAALLTASLYFIIGNAHRFHDTAEQLEKYANVRLVLLAHIAGGAVALLTGPFQFWDALRIRVKKAHRRIGLAYVAGVAVSGPCAARLAFSTAYDVSWAYAFSLQVWASLWMTATAIAYWHAWRKRFETHKDWMVRSYLLTLAFVSSALLLKVPLVARQASFAELSTSLFWFAWAVPLFVYDVALSSRRKPRSA